jgi:hypothetical protein
MGWVGEDSDRRSRRRLSPSYLTHRPRPPPTRPAPGLRDAARPAGPPRPGPGERRQRGPTGGGGAARTTRRPARRPWPRSRLGDSDLLEWCGRLQQGPGRRVTQVPSLLRLGVKQRLRPEVAAGRPPPPPPRRRRPGPPPRGWISQPESDRRRPDSADFSLRSDGRVAPAMAEMAAARRDDGGGRGRRVRSRQEDGTDEGASADVGAGWGTSSFGRGALAGWLDWGDGYGPKRGTARRLISSIAKTICPTPSRRCRQSAPEWQYRTTRCWNSLPRPHRIRRTGNQSLRGKRRIFKASQKKISDQHQSS